MCDANDNLATLRRDEETKWAREKLNMFMKGVTILNIFISQRMESIDGKGFFNLSKMRVLL
jgi:hypothetical protein